MDGNIITALAKRANTFEDCDDDQRTKAGQALADAAVLARWTDERRLWRDKEYQNTDA